MQEVRLTPTSYIVLGLLEFAGESTPYGLKQLVAGSVGYFWTLQHAQLYTEPERLARGGYVTETREETGRRRKLYAITAKGTRALEEWRTETTSALAELREPALLKLFFGADPGAAGERAAAREPARLAEYERIRDSMSDDVRPGPRPALELGIRVERETIAFWEELAGLGFAPMATAAEPSRPSCRSRAAATGAKVRLHPLLTAHRPGPARVVPARGGPLRVAQGVRARRAEGPVAQSADPGVPARAPERRTRAGGHRLPRLRGREPALEPRRVRDGHLPRHRHARRAGGGRAAAREGHRAVEREGR